MCNNELILDYINFSQKQIYKKVKEQKSTQINKGLNIVKKLNFDNI
jgi:hypothetical protein